jgi:hypothetical protein
MSANTFLPTLTFPFIISWSISFLLNKVKVLYTKKQTPSTLYKLVTSRQRVIRMKHETSWSFPYNEVVEDRINNEQQYK